MTDPQRLATSYLSPSLDAFWRWSGDGEVLTWADGRTIAFRAEVDAVLARLAPHGLPPFGAVAVLLAACRVGWAESPGREVFRGYARVFGQWQTGQVMAAGPAAASAAAATEVEPPARDPLWRASRQASRLVFAAAARDVGKVLDGLDAVGRLPPSLREGAEAKAVLAEAVFEAAAAKAVPAADAGALLRAMSDGVEPSGLLPHLSTRESLGQFAEDIDALRAGLATVTEDSLALRVRTGLDALVNPADLDLAPSERVRRLLAELRQDKELAGLARLAQDLMAAVHVPRALHARDELPLGGVSDLSNRGPLDRLLVSELAHDDLTLAVRVATNEALFLRRESPPRQPPSRRAILIDCGVRMWGIPRAFGAAVALALVATADKRADVVAYRATPGGVERVDLLTRRGLVDCLAALEAAPHPGASLAAFFDRLAERRDGLTDALLVTHPDVLADPDFAAAVRALDDPAFYVAAVARDGAFRLTALTAAGRKPVREATLSLDAILAPSAGAGRGPAGLVGPPLRVKDIDPALPVILSAEPFPLLLPAVVEARAAAASPRLGVVAATKDGRLMHWAAAASPGLERGARQLTALLPRGNLRGIFLDDAAGLVTAVIAHRRTAQTFVVTASLATGQCAMASGEVPGPEPEGVFVHAGMLYLLSRRQVDGLDLTVNRWAPPLPLPGDAVWRGGRFLYVDRRWLAVAYDGSRIVLEPVPDLMPRPPMILPPLAVFDRAGADGPAALLWDGRVVAGAGRAVLPMPKPPFDAIHRLVGTSADGTRLVVTVNGANFAADLAKAAAGWEQLHGDPHEYLVGPAFARTRSPVNLRTRFRGVFCGSRGELWLRTRHGREMAVERYGDRLRLVDRGSSPAPPLMREFTQQTRVPGARFDLSVASWPDGSRAFLDSRGLLHLKSSGRGVPEVALVLGDPWLAGWASDGTAFGAKYFIGDAPATSAVHFDDLIRRFTGRLR